MECLDVVQPGKVDRIGLGGANIVAQRRQGCNDYVVRIAKTPLGVPQIALDIAKRRTVRRVLIYADLGDSLGRQVRVALLPRGPFSRRQRLLELGRAVIQIRPNLLEALELVAPQQIHAGGEGIEICLRLGDLDPNIGKFAGIVQSGKARLGVQGRLRLLLELAQFVFLPQQRLMIGPDSIGGLPGLLKPIKLLSAMATRQVEYVRPADGVQIVTPGHLARDPGREIGIGLSALEQIIDRDGEAGRQVRAGHGRHLGRHALALAGQTRALQLQPQGLLAIRPVAHQRYRGRPGERHRPEQPADRPAGCRLARGVWPDDHVEPLAELGKVESLLLEAGHAADG